MKKEYKIFSAIVGLFVTVVVILALIFKKYTYIVLSHFVENCQTIAAGLNSLLIHLVGAAIITTILLFALIFFGKTLFSIIKTQKKVKSLRSLEVKSYPKKLRQILESKKLKRMQFILVESENDLAITIGVITPRIVISTALVLKLNIQELESVILHEFYHSQNRHAFLLMASEVISSTLFFLPVLHDLTRKMRGIIEKEADFFVILNQKTERHLNLAVLKVRSKEVYSYYPTFSQRLEHTVKWKNIFVSIFVGFLAIGLMLFPVDIYADVEKEEVDQISQINCGENQCSTHCLTEKDHLRMTPVLQSYVSY